MAIVTVAQADAHLHLDLETDSASPPVYTDSRLADVELKIAQAEAAILDYIEMEEADLTGSGSTDQWLMIVHAAVLLYLQWLFDGDGDALEQNGPIARLLRRIRYPAIA